ncbi:MAG TPA: ABC transporter permease, partial [Rhodothermales bacterium]|nr:ABC transporter permease [Rhodothermales bacterium]
MNAPKHDSPMTPPQAASWLLERCTAPHRHPEIVDDLDDLFQIRAKRLGLAQARWRYWRDVVSICLRRSLHTPPKTTYSYSYETARGPIMLKNYLKIALRNLRRHTGYAFLNLTGLAVGIACCLLIIRYVQHELSYDRFHENANHIYRVVENRLQNEGQEVRTAASPGMLAPLLEDEFGVIEKTVRFMRYSVFNVPIIGRGANQRFAEPDFLFADSTVFEVFSFPFVAGDPATALDAPMSVVITKSMAEKYFGKENPLGQTLTFENNFDLTVTGVVQDLPATSHIHFDFLASFSSLGTIEGAWIYQAFNWPPMYTYVLLSPRYDAALLEARLPDFVGRILGEDVAARRSFTLQPLTSIHLHSHREEELEPNSDMA